MRVYWLESTPQINVFLKKIMNNMPKYVISSSLNVYGNAEI